MKITYKELEKAAGMKLYDVDLPSKLIGIAHEYAKLVTEANEKIFTGEFKDGLEVIKYPANFKERLSAQNLAINAKMKLVEKYSDIFGKEEILLAMISYRP